MSNIRYLEICPRNFANEMFIVCGTQKQIKKAYEDINDDPNAWAKIISASDKLIRNMKRDGKLILPLDESYVRRYYHA